ncbi:MAG: hypothetical protein ABFS14_01200 [Gemmatimonadota bacterium]
MMRGMKMILSAAVGMAAFGSASPALAQDRAMYELAPIEVNIMTGADALHEQAVALYDQPARWEEAAELHLRAAESQRDNAVESFGGFDRAARLFYYAGEFGQSRRAMEEALKVAMATGDVLTSAHVAVDVAFIASREGYGGKKRQSVRLARELADSDLLSETDRTGILERIDGGADTSALAVRRLVPRRFAAAGLSPVSL